MSGAGSPPWFLRLSRRLVIGGAGFDHRAFTSVSSLVGPISGGRMRVAVSFFGFVAPVGGALWRVPVRCRSFHFR
jgi:hypothetical protein